MLGAQAQLGAAGAQRLAQRPLQAVGDRHRLEHSADALAQDRELVAAEARHGVLRPHHALEALGDLAQHLVAGAVAERVVDALEAVEVEEVDGGGRIAVAPGEHVAQAVAEQRPVGQAGERVVQGQALELDLHALAIGDVEEDAVEERVLAGLAVEHDGHLVADPDVAAVGRAQAVLLDELLARARALGLVRRRRAPRRRGAGCDPTARAPRATGRRG